jgi:hypothetical protein
MEKSINYQIIEENEKLLTQLFLAKKLIEILEKFRFYLQNIINNCKCDENNFNDRQQLNHLENEYNNFNKNKDILLLNKGINNNESNGTHFKIIKIEENFDNINNGLTHNLLNINNNNNNLISNSDLILNSNKSENKKQKRSLKSVKKQKTNKSGAKKVEINNSIIDNSSNGLNIKAIELRRNECLECSKSYESLKLLKAHQRVVHCEQRRYKCSFDDCSVKMKTKQQINQHIKIHYEDRPYVCEWPGCQFRLTNNQ